MSSANSASGRVGSITKFARLMKSGQACASQEERNRDRVGRTFLSDKPSPHLKPHSGDLGHRRMKKTIAIVAVRTSGEQQPELNPLGDDTLKEAEIRKIGQCW